MDNMRVIKRDGSESPFDISKITSAVSRANREVSAAFQLDDASITSLAENVANRCELLHRSIQVEEIQEFVETALMQVGAYEIAKRYIRYRYDHNLRRTQNTIDAAVMNIVEYANEEAKQENSNKDPEIIPTQRDYIAGEVSKDLTKRVLLPKEIVEAHEAGIIHFHDADYFLQHSHNCDLVNLEDMLQNGTVISGTMIEKPHSFSTACTIATQVIAQVASNQYGGQSISLAHIAPFVDVSRKRFYEQHKKLLDYMNKDEYASFIEGLVNEEIRKGVQTIQYQVITLMTTNGQAPFITVYMNINEVEPGQTRDDLARIIEEMLKQRIQGVKNEVGVWITPAFPKLIYALDENNVSEGSEYYYLTVLAAKCTAKRMVPDYISNKVMRELKIDKNGNGNTYTCMGCRSFLTPYVDENGKPKYYGRLTSVGASLNLVNA